MSVTEEPAAASEAIVTSKVMRSTGLLASPPSSPLPAAARTSGPELGADEVSPKPRSALTTGTLAVALPDATTVPPKPYRPASPKTPGPAPLSVKSELRVRVTVSPGAGWSFDATRPTDADWADATIVHAETHDTATNREFFISRLLLLARAIARTL